MRTSFLATMALLLTIKAAMAANYIDPEELKPLLEQKKPVVIVDIQPAADFAAHHFAGAIETNAFPAKNAEEKKRLDKTIPVIKGSAAPVVVVCPRGKSGAKNSYEYLVSQGIPEDRLQILDGGIAEWPFKELFVTGSAQQR